MVIVKVADEAAVISTLGVHIVQAAQRAIDATGVFRIGLSGGSLVKYLGQLAADGHLKGADWPKWQVFFCDERYVPESDADSTYGQYAAKFVPLTGLKAEQFLRLDFGVENVKECAHAYEQEMYKRFGIQDLDFRTIPKFDLLLLGMGPDGHTCSLFPGHALLTEDQVLIAPISDSPKPPPSRITMTYPLINNARACVFAMSGAGKADMLRRIHANGERLPAGLVQPTEGTLTWIVDEAAGEFLPVSAKH